MIAGHTLTGESIVARIPYLSPIAPVIRSAHERWDGGGYPDRLRGEDVPVAARIVFACDCCHAMVSDRPYRKAMTHEAAFAELEDQAGAQFDPQVVEAFVASRDAIERLLMQGPQAARQADRVLATVLVTDIVGSTEKAAEIGDGAYRLLIDRHHDAVRDLLRRYRGTEVDTAGDGFLARFDGAARAVECAAAVGRALEPLGLEIRAGCHTGEIEVTGGGARGIAVHIGARVAALAGPGEILVSSIVKDLVAGSGLEFSGPRRARAQGRARDLEAVRGGSPRVGTGARGRVAEAAWSRAPAQAPRSTSRLTAARRSGGTHGAHDTTPREG